jgi:hypothetical protein
MCAREVSLVALIWIIIAEYTLENDPMHAKFARKLSHSDPA